MVAPLGHGDAAILLAMLENRPKTSCSSGHATLDIVYQEVSERVPVIRVDVAGYHVSKCIFWT